MDISLFDYHLPKDSIAHKPVTPRDACKFLVYHRNTKNSEDRQFKDLVSVLNAGDVLVLNNTRVIPSRVFGYKETGGAIEVLLVHKIEGKRWKALIRGKARPKSPVFFHKSKLVITPVEKVHDAWIVKVNLPEEQLKKELNIIGSAPLPPYITSQNKEKKIRSDYQTVFSHTDGSVAAPTAGLHFTQRLLDRLRKKGIRIEYVTLHVGLGTFNPVRTNDIREHTMHEEFVYVPRRTMQRLVKAKRMGSRLVAVGTTSVRVLEGVVAHQLDKPLRNVTSYKGDVNIFIYPGYNFRVLDGLITNFHLPKSSLIMLVSALMGREECLCLYKYAIKNDYRFYSFGDAMMIL